VENDMYLLNVIWNSIN